jgi:acyl-CoA reductase-like NAD-dependent aldehyde dehydrogenase
MREEDVDRILDAADAGFQVIGLRSFEEGANRAYQILARLLDLLSRANNRDAAKRALIEGSDISPEQLEEVLSLLQGIAYRIREMMPELTKSIPHEPGGRPRSLTEIQKRQVCTEIASWYGRGVRVGIAIKRVAQKYGVSQRTVRRAWRGRGISNRT